MKLTKRDFEILRTLVRVQLARTRSLQRAFFPNMGVARRRLRGLRSYGLITTHTRGLPGDLAAAGGAYWRLTDRGLSEMVAAFPGHRIPDNHVVRTQRASLRCFEHRDEMTDTYLRLIYSQDQDWDEIGSRADLLDWRGEYEVALEYDVVGARRRVIPDATLTTEGRRLFIEVDRSTESHTRCKRTLQGYRQSLRQGKYAEQFPDKLPVTVVYVTRSARRAKGLQDLVGRLGELPYKGMAMTVAQASEWLRDMTGTYPVNEEDGVRAELATARVVLRKLYDDFRQVATELKAEGRLPQSGNSLIAAYEYLRAVTPEGR